VNNVEKGNSVSEKLENKIKEKVSEQSGKYSASEKMNRDYNGKNSEAYSMPKKAA